MFCEVRDTSLVLLWKAPVYSGSSPVSGYFVDYEEEDSGEWITFNEAPRAHRYLKVTALLPRLCRLGNTFHPCRGSSSKPPGNCAHDLVPLLPASGVQGGARPSVDLGSDCVWGPSGWVSSPSCHLTTPSGADTSRSWAVLTCLPQ